MTKPFGEIISSSLTTWTIQCWDLEQFSPFGFLVSSDNQDAQLFGIVCAITTGPKDAGRTPHAFGKTPLELRHEQPHIFQLLHTQVAAIPLGYVSEDEVIYEVPKRPAHIHAFARPCSVQEFHTFFSHAQWLIVFFNLAQQHPLFDELLVSLVHHACAHKALTQEKMQDIIDLFCLLSNNDYKKLKIFLQRIEAFIY